MFAQYLKAAHEIERIVRILYTRQIELSRSLRRNEAEAQLISDWYELAKVERQVALQEANDLNSHGLVVELPNTSGTFENLLRKVFRGST